MRENELVLAVKPDRGWRKFFRPHWRGCPRAPPGLFHQTHPARHPFNLFIFDRILIRSDQNFVIDHPAVACILPPLDRKLGASPP
jgi:hypothetical protein